MRSVRLDPELEARLASAARAEDITESEFIREALRRRCDAVLADNLARELEDLGVVGAASLGGASARDSGRRFTEILSERRGKRQ
ncbi:MAG TPA: CopG family transcriptional regulator [Chloroflexota bacterium]